MTEQQLDRVTDLIKKGCGISGEWKIITERKGEAEVGIKILKPWLPRAEGEISVSDEGSIDGALAYLLDEDKNTATDNKEYTRECFNKYMDKIFISLGQKEETSLSSKNSYTFARPKGFFYEFKKCKKFNTNDIDCSFSVTSPLFDRTISLASFFIDGNGNKIKLSQYIVGNESDSSPSKYSSDNEKIFLAADTATNLTLIYNNAPSNIKKISLLYLTENSREPGRKNTKFTHKIRNITIE